MTDANAKKIEELSMVLVDNAEYCLELIQERLGNFSQADLDGTYHDLIVAE